jgi:Fur family transcriptional regulator, ferric uptake regulator
MELHDEIALRLAATGQRYTTSRRALVDVLIAAGGPLTVPEVAGGSDASDLRVRSTYRNLTVLVDGGIVRRVPGNIGHDRFELAEHLSGHHHHIVCTDCGRATDIAASPRVERVLAEAARSASAESGFEIVGHSIDLVGLCSSCRS